MPLELIATIDPTGLIHELATYATLALAGLWFLSHWLRVAGGTGGPSCNRCERAPTPPTPSVCVESGRGRRSPALRVLS